jgi:hypothetical protein
MELLTKLGVQWDIQKDMWPQRYQESRTRPIPYNEMDIVTVRMYGWIYLCTYGLIYTELDCYTLIPSYYYSDAWCSITRTIL